MKKIKAFILLLIFTSLTFSQWNQSTAPEGGGITDMVALNDGTILATTSSFNWPNGDKGGIRRSTNDGERITDA